MGVQFGMWPPSGKEPTDQQSMQIRGSVKIGSDGTVGNDSLGVVDSVNHSVTGQYIISLKLGTLNNNWNVVATLAGNAGEVDCTISGSAATVHTRASADGALADRSFNLLILG